MADAPTMIVDPQEYLVGDQPRITGSMSNSAGAVLTPDLVSMVTLRGINDNDTFFLSESRATLATSGAFEFNFRERLLRWQYGYLYGRAYWRDSVDAVLSGPIDATQTTATLAVNTGTIPNNGTCVIEGEACTFEKVTDTTITIGRAYVNTTGKASACAAPVVLT